MVKIGRVIPRRRSTPTAPPPPHKVALLIGIDYIDAETSEYCRLHRARSDTKAFRDLLINNYDYLPENVIMMLDEDGISEKLWPTRENILQQIDKLVAGAQSGSRFVFFFSGHSGQVADPKNREADGLDEYIVPVDHAQLANDDAERPMKKIMILDNTLRKKLVNPLPTGANLTAIFDSCHSGTLLDLDHYLCNSVYHPWTDIGFRRHLTKWLGVRRKDGQRMSQAGVKVVMRRAKPVHPDKKGKGRASSTPIPSRENSECSVRIHQLKRLSNHQLEKIDVAFSVTDSQDGMRRELSYSSRRSSVQCKPSLSQIIEGEQSMESLMEEIPRCASPTDMECNGFCPDSEGTPDSATVVSISSCHDNQRTWESKHGSFTHWLIEQLRDVGPAPHQPIGRLALALTHKMYTHAQMTHKWSLEQKNKITQSIHMRETSGSSGESSSSASCSSGTAVSVTMVRGETEEETHHLDHSYDYTDVPVPVVRVVSCSPPGRAF
ncbi:hypothetical protein L227DRAFT_502006 [Lentinus tigrinus ALCF2SS1-6]|uniref:Peptidase C14 caspase domain-containing protein n=1 Tax=Lentinus tigrinus ALCF2SS1-6 TaxID=1328759 RepID=A0A5C2SB26_9APHY|nr:hypothetical protein L227DRAFT_502006 [Lentinus tigrinus ALCF2SS1-6]